MNTQQNPQHDEIEASRGEASQEPLSGDLDILLSLPATIEVRMVDASALSDYEIWFFSSSALLTFMVGFLVAWVQESDQKAGKILGVVTIIFAILFLLCLLMTLVKRHMIRQKSRTIKLKTSKVAEMKPNKNVN